MSDLERILLYLFFPIPDIHKMIKATVKAWFEELEWPKDEYIDEILEYIKTGERNITFYLASKQIPVTKGVQTEKQFRFFVEYLNNVFPGTIGTMVNIWCMETKKEHPKRWREILEEGKNKLMFHYYYDTAEEKYTFFAGYKYLDYAKLIESFIQLHSRREKKEPKIETFKIHPDVKITKFYQLYTLLVEKGFIPPNTDKQNFVDIFRGILPPHPIVWLGGKNVLAYLIKILRKRFLTNRRYPIKFINKCFIDKTQKSVSLTRSLIYLADKSTIAQKKFELISQILDQISKP